MRSYDVFLSYNSRDRDSVEHLARRLRDELSFEVWFDQWNLIPGTPWQEQLEDGLNESKVIAVFLGSAGFGKWENEEMRVAIESRVINPALRLIPVLLPGASESVLSVFIRRLSWVDFRAGLDDKTAFYNLECGIRGISPGNALSMRKGKLREIEELSISDPGDKAMVLTDQYLPPKPYSRFIGREKELDEILGVLREPEAKPIIAIVGLGGIGKTALAREAAERLLEEKFFKHLVWVGFKTEHFVGERINRSIDFSYSFDDMLNDILRQCTRTNIAHMSADQKRAEVANLFNTEKVMILLDNLETYPERENLVSKIFEILGQSKLLLTSRHQFRHERVYTIHLSGFSKDEGLAFLRAEGKERGIDTVTSAGHSSLAEIFRGTGGAPLAMKLVAGQINRQPIHIVLKELKKASSKGQYYDLYYFIYHFSWVMLSVNARMVLVDMSVFPHDTGGAVKDVEAISQVQASDFWLAMDQLVSLSLVIKSGEAGKERFALHELTQNFIRSDIIKEKAWLTNKKNKTDDDGRSKSENRGSSRWFRK